MRRTEMRREEVALAGPGPGRRCHHAGVLSSASRFAPIRDHGFAGETRISRANALRVPSGQNQRGCASVGTAHQVAGADAECVQESCEAARRQPKDGNREWDQHSEKPEPGMSTAKTSS